MDLTKAELTKTYQVTRITADDEELKAFLFRLGCYEGEPITVISKTKRNYVIAIKEGRYNIDEQLAAHIEVNTVGM